MRVIPSNRKADNGGAAAEGAASGHECAAASEPPEPGGFWHRLAAGIDSFAAYPVKHALSDRESDHVDAQIERCRQLMSGRQSRRDAAVVSFRLAARPVSRHVLVPVKVRP